MLTQGGLPETGDGIGHGGPMGAATASAETQVADVPRPRAHGPAQAGGGVRVDARRGGSIHIAKVEVHLTTPQVGAREAQRIGKMVVDDIARQAVMKELSG